MKTETIPAGERGGYQRAKESRALMHGIANDIALERERQNQKWGVQRHTWPEWIAILTEELGEASKCAVEEHWHPTGDLTHLREELVQVAAVAVQIIEHIDEVTS